MNVIDERNKRNKIRRVKKQLYDRHMRLSAVTPVSCGEDLKLKSLRAENENLKSQIAILKYELAHRNEKRVKETPTYTDGIGM